MYNSRIIKTAQFPRLVHSRPEFIWSHTLAELVARARYPDARLEELRQQLRRETKVEASISTIWRGLERIEFAQKKEQTRARG
jgi:transposase